MAYTKKEDRQRYAAKHYAENADLYKKRASDHSKKAKAEARGWLLSYLLAHPCIDCGETDPVVLEFDHKTPGEKQFHIAEAMRRKFSLPRIMEEVGKCDIRCANCHRRKTYREAGFTHRTV